MLAVFADWAGRFYAEPGVTLTMQVLALNFVIIPFGSVTMALLVRNMDFAKTLQINLACCVVQNATAIGLAWAGFGFISLAWGAVASTLLSSVVLLWFRFPGQSWLPGLREWRHVFSAGFKLSSSTFLYDIGQGGPELICGRTLGFEAVAFFSRGFGAASMLLRALAYKVHPYRWATIGLTPDHIAGATLDDVQAFYRTHYHPSNAILSVSADFDEERMLDLAEKWFAPLADRTVTPQPIPREPQQEAPRRETVERDVPATTLSLAFHMGGRTSQDFYTADLVSDLLSGGDSSRLYKHLVQEQRLLASVNAYISGDVDPGLFVFTGQLLPDTTPEQAEAAFRAEIEALQSVPASDYEVEKVKNKFEANTLFGELNVMNKAMNLGFYEMLGDLPLVNREVAAYRAVTTDDIIDFSRRTFRPENCSTLIYKASK